MNELKRQQSVLREMQPLIKDLRNQEFGTNTRFTVFVAASIVKAFEFAQTVHRKRALNEAYFLTATLRGICEEYIVLKYLLTWDEDDRNDFGLAWSMRSTLSGLETQQTFFSQHRPSQPVLGYSQATAAARTSVDSDLARLHTKYKWPGGPTKLNVRQAADSAQVQALYDYVYAATSEWVHFSPHLLYRMGWGPEAEEGRVFTYSTSNFAGYYVDFCRFYSLYLLRFQLDTFSDFLGLGERAVTVSTALNEIINDTLRWPEMVTFEEMNLKPPSAIIRMLLHSEHRLKNRTE